MKTTQQLMKAAAALKAGLFGMLLLFGLLSTSCKKAEDTTVEETTTETTVDTVATPDTNKDADFLMEAATINIDEIELGKLARIKASSADVKAFGKMMIDGHTKALEEVKALAASKNVTLPTEPDAMGKDLAAQLSALEGKDFDREYADKMVDGHKDAISKFEAARDNTSDADVKAWIEKTLPDLQMHLDHAVTVQQKVK